MPGNGSQHRGVRKSRKKGPSKGSGGLNRKGLRGKGPTPKAENRPYHAAYKRKQENDRRNSGRHIQEKPDMVVGRNPVVECLHANAPASQLYVALGTKDDPRLTEAVRLAHSRNIPISEVDRFYLDQLTGNSLHQGIGLVVEPYSYTDVHALMSASHDGTPGLVVVLDNITDPRNLGAVIRSVAAFGGHGVVIPERRSAAVTAVAWRSSAGMAARVPVARATNLTRTLKEFQKQGFQVVGLDAGGDHTLDTYDGTTPTVIVVGSEGKGLSRLVRETCDSIMAIPMAPGVESLNASVAAGVVLSEFARQRRSASTARHSK